MIKDFQLTDEEKDLLLKIAREIIKDYLTLGRLYTESDLQAKYKITKTLEQDLGAFVSLHKNIPQGDKPRSLRGCIGFIEGTKPLYKSVAENAINAAIHDPRFSPLKPEELDEVNIEISVLTPLQTVESPEEIVVGRDGVVLTKGFNKGVLLPQVPVDLGWGREEFLKHVCLKAGISPDSWKDPSITLQRFEAIVFHEPGFEN